MKRFVLFLILLLILPCLLTSCENWENASQSTSVTTASNTNAITPITTAHSHSFSEWVTVTEATCVKEGSRVRVCLCGQKETEAIKMVSHSYIDAVCTICNQKDPNSFDRDYSFENYNIVGTCDSEADCTVQDDYIYFSKENIIYKVNIKGRVLEEVYRALVGNIHYVNVVGDWIYFFCEERTQDQCYIGKVRTDGAYFEKLVSSVFICELLVVKDIVYYVSYPIDYNYVAAGKEYASLYSISTDGGMKTRIHYGSVFELTADEKYLYFVHLNNNEKRTVCRIEHGGSSKMVLLENVYVTSLTIANSQLYMLTRDEYDDQLVYLASMKTNGSSYTIMTKCLCSSSYLHVKENRAYFLRSSSKNPNEYGVIEYNMNTKKCTSISWDFSPNAFADGCIWLVYDEEDKLAWITIYYSKTGELKKIEFS